jgi:hypothetical protein
VRADEWMMMVGMRLIGANTGRGVSMREHEI